jgi:hypothetical protein
MGGVLSYRLQICNPKVNLLQILVSVEHVGNPFWFARFP